MDYQRTTWMKEEETEDVHNETGSMSYRTATMDHQRVIWMKEEETDDVHYEHGSMVHEDPLKMEEPSVHIKRDPELKFHEDNSCITVTMDHQSAMWMKNEETDDVFNEPGSMVPEDPLRIEEPSVHVKRDPEPKRTEDNFLQDPWVNSLSTDFIKEDPAIHLEEDETENATVTSRRCVSSSTRLIQYSGERCDVSFEEILDQGMVHSELEKGAGGSTHFTMFNTPTQGLTVQEEEEGGGGEEEDEEYSLFGTRLKCRSREKKFSTSSCSVCLQSFASKYRLIMHVFLHIDGVQPPMYVCKLCGEVFLSDVSMKKHLQMNKDDQTSTTCHNGNYEKMVLEGHKEVSVTEQMKKQSSAKETRKISMKPFNDKHSTRNETHTAEKRDSHDDNGPSSATLNVNDHTAPLTAERPHKCDVCWKSFTYLRRLKRHKLIHNGIKPHKCDICGKSFTELGNLKVHSAIHTGIKPHKCDICGKSFAQLSHLMVHSVIHTGIKPHKCDICGKTFARLTDLKSHASIHSGIKPHKCDICGKTFTRLGNLKSHLLIHTRIKPHKCDICGKSFIMLGNLRRHALIHTK